MSGAAILREEEEDRRHSDRLREEGEPFETIGPFGPEFVAASLGRRSGKLPFRRARGRRRGPFDLDGAFRPDLKGVGIREED